MIARAKAGSVYVVDGDPAVRDSLHTLLELNGFHVETFDSGAALREHIGVDACSCIVCEEALPDMTGLELYRWLRNRGVAAPFGLLMSRRDPATISAARALGVDGVFPKPLVHRRLLAFVMAVAGPPPESHSGSGRSARMTLRSG